MDTCIEVSVASTPEADNPMATVVVKPCDETVTDPGVVVVEPITTIVNSFETFEVIPRGVYTALTGAIYSPVFDSKTSSMYLYIKSLGSVTTAINKLLWKVEAYDVVNDTYFTIPGSGSEADVSLTSNTIILVNPALSTPLVESMQIVIPSQWRLRCDLWGPAGATTEFFVSGSYVNT